MRSTALQLINMNNIYKRKSALLIKTLRLDANDRITLITICVLIRLLWDLLLIKLHCLRLFRNETIVKMHHNYISHKFELR